MKKCIPILVLLCGFLFGCAQKGFDASRAGELQFRHTTVENGTPVQYEWVIPADELTPVLEQMTPRDPKFKGALLSSHHTAELTYEGKPVRMTWSRVKQAEIVLLITIGNEEFMLREPQAGEFYRLLQTHKKRRS